jgi:hypothetical protein
VFPSTRDPLILIYFPAAFVEESFPVKATSPIKYSLAPDKPAFVGFVVKFKVLGVTAPLLVSPFIVTSALIAKAPLKVPPFAADTKSV